jgi:TctA family transporter
VIGLFGISEILLTMEERLALRGHAARSACAWCSGCGWKCRATGSPLRSSLIGCWLGITPGGRIAASFMGYNLAKRFSKDQGSFGKGRIEACSRRRRRRTPRAPRRCCRCSPSASRARHAAILLGGLMVWGLTRAAALRRAQGLRLGLIASMYLGNVVGLSSC